MARKNIKEPVLDPASKIEQKALGEISPYDKNPRKNDDAVDAVAASISEFGFKNPIIVDKDMVIIAGHTRYKAAKKLGMKEVPVIVAKDLTEEQVRAFRLADNKTAELAMWDEDLLDEELSQILDINMDSFGFDSDLELNNESSENPYTAKITAPQYEPTGMKVDLRDCVDETKTNELLSEIDAADVPEDVKDFLRLGAQRHLRFNYRNIAEYYANADPDVQELFEKSALVIIDYDDALRNGFVTVSDALKELVGEDED